MNIFMTGAEGYIGSHFKKLLEDNNYIVDSLSDFLFEDIRAIKQNSIDFSRYDFVFHFAGLGGVRKSIEIPEEYYDINVNGSRALFELCEESNTPIIYMSSSNAKEWWTNPYATTKKIIEEIAPKNSLGIRPHTVYPGRADMLYHKLSTNPKQVEYINGAHYRDFTHIEDFCSGLFTLFQNYDIIDTRVVDIGTGKAQSVLRLADKAGWHGMIVRAVVRTERTVTEADISTLTKLGWKPKYESCDFK